MTERRAGILPWRPHFASLVAYSFALVGLILLGASRAAAAADVLTQHNDNARTGVNAAETVLTTGKVKPATFGRLWTLYVDGQISAQPLYVSQLRIDTSTNPSTPLVQGTFNTVILATMHNAVYAYNADAENRLPDGKTKPLWATWLGQPRGGGKDIDMWSTNDPEWGILATPVVDPQKTTVWVVAWHDEGGVQRYRLHALNLKDGSPRLPSIIIGGDPPNPSQPCNYPNGYNPCKQKQRASLLLDRGIVYVAFGGDGSRGALFAYDANTLQQRAFWSPTPTGNDGGIWQSGQGPAADAEGNVYLMTANGTFDANTPGGQNYGESFVKLKMENGALVVKDYFTPCNQQFLSSIDLDLGSSGPILIPGTNLLFGGGKEGVIYLLSRTNMGTYAASPTAPNCKNTNAVQEFPATVLHRHGAGTTWGHIHGSLAFWKGPDRSRAYVWGENDHLRAYTFSQGKFVGVDNPKMSAFRPPDGMPGGMLAVSSNGTNAGTGIVWAVVPLDGDANTRRGVQGVVLALDAQDVSKQLWTSELSGPRDRLGLFAKFVPPTIADGKVFVATYGDKELQREYKTIRPQQFPASSYLAVYGLLPHPPHEKPIVNQGGEDVAVTKAGATPPVPLNSGVCPPADPGNVDCTAALSQALGAPSLHTVIVPSGYDFGGCEVLRVTTASKQTGLANATGIGWYSAEATAGAQAMTTGRLIPKADLKQVGTGTLKSGAPAILHEFVGLANCSAGQGSLDKLFKPYMQFENAPDGKIYRNWDVAQNYRISRGFPQFDRSGDVLAP